MSRTWDVIHVEVDQDDINALLGKLKNINGAPNKLKNAINRTATQTAKQLRAGVQQSYTAKTKRLSQNIRVTKRASPTHLNATIRAFGRPPTLKNFHTTAPRSGVKANVLTSSGLKLIKGNSAAGAAFKATGGKTAGLITQRKGRSRFPVKVLYGPSVSKMMEKLWQGEHGLGDIEAQTRETLHAEIQKEIAKLI